MYSKYKILRVKQFFSGMVEQLPAGVMTATGARLGFLQMLRLTEMQCILSDKSQSQGKDSSSCSHFLIFGLSNKRLRTIDASDRFSLDCFWC